MTARHTNYRRAILPHQLAAARAMVAHLESEARHLCIPLVGQPSSLPLYGQAKDITNSDAVMSIFAAPEWDELGNDGKEWVVGLIRETLGRSVAPILLEALYALIGVEPSNSDDPDDAEQCAAWRQAHDAIALAVGSPNLLIVPASPLSAGTARRQSPPAAAPTLSIVQPENPHG
ncbi:hypothetical protein ACIPPQ_14565 [Sphingopyxis sp. LARHCG72]